jgi:hypothetical protein
MNVRREAAAMAASFVFRRVNRWRCTDAATFALPSLIALVHRMTNRFLRLNAWPTRRRSIEQKRRINVRCSGSRVICGRRTGFFKGKIDNNPCPSICG